MATATATKRKLVGLDQDYGWEFGVDGFMNAREAAEELGISQTHMCRILRRHKKVGIKRPTDRTWPLRAGRAPGEKSGEWQICRRSLMEYKSRRQPVEV